VGAPRSVRSARPSGAAAAARRFDFAAERFEPFGAASRRRYVVSFGREPERRGASDARCGSRDQCLFFHKVGL